MTNLKHKTVLIVTEESETLARGPQSSALDVYGGSFQAIRVLKKRIENSGGSTRVLILSTRNGWIDGAHRVMNAEPNRARLRSPNFMSHVRKEFHRFLSGGDYQKIVLSLSERYFRALFPSDEEFVSTFGRTDLEVFLIAGRRLISHLKQSEAERLKLRFFERHGVARITSAAYRALLPEAPPP